VPVQIKITGIIMLPVIILGLTLNYWITTGLSDWLSYILTDQRVEAAMAAGSRSVILVTILAAMASIFFGVLLTYLLTRPLLDLNQTAQEVGSGKLDSRARVWANDEIGQVAKSVNRMINRLLSTQSRLTHTNRRLEALNRVAMAAGRELDLQVVLDSIMQGVLEVLDQKTGWIFILDSDTNRFELACSANVPHIYNVRTSGQNGKHCECQQNLFLGKLDGTSINVCTRSPTSSTDDTEQLHLSLPLQARGQSLGIVNVLCQEGFAPREEDLELVTAIAAQGSEILLNAWLHARLLEKEAARRALLKSLVLTQEDERRRLAMDLHDGAGQTLTTLLVRLKTMEKKSPGGPISDGLKDLQSLVSGSIEQIRDLSYRLRPANLEEFGLARALQHLAEDMVKDTGIVLATDMDEVHSLPEDVETALFRITQESLTNSLRHANAHKIEIELKETPLGVCLRVEDDGVGFDPVKIPEKTPQPHLGLIGIQERVEMLGGSLNVYSGLGAGTSLQVRIPLVENVEEP
jgi:signal transduction histidine kinase